MEKLDSAWRSSTRRGGAGLGVEEPDSAWRSRTRRGGAGLGVEKLDSAWRSRTRRGEPRAAQSGLNTTAVTFIDESKLLFIQS